MIKVILLDGTETSLAEWQKLYGLPVGSDNIGHYYSLQDPKIAENYRLHGYLVVVEPLMRLADLAREKDGEPWPVNAFNRSERDQKRIDADPQFAAAKFSPHVVNMAMDTGCAKYDTVINPTNGKKTFVFSIEKTKVEVYQKVRLLQEAAAELGYKIRIGYKEYMNLKVPMYFVHFDVCPMYYGAGMPYHSHSHPWQWENSITW